MLTPNSAADSSASGTPGQAIGAATSHDYSRELAPAGILRTPGPALCIHVFLRDRDLKTWMAGPISAKGSLTGGRLETQTVQRLESGRTGDARVHDGAAGRSAPGPAAARAAEAEGYDGIISMENKHDPFLALAVAGAATERIELHTGVAISFARTPMAVAQVGWDLAGSTGGRFVDRARLAGARP